MTATKTQTIPTASIQTGDNVRGDLGNIAELARSIERHGLLNPLTVRRMNAANGPVPLGKTAELVAGHRRLAAVRKLGWVDVPVTWAPAFDGADSDRVDSERLAIQLVENLQREDLDPLDEAAGLVRLVELLGSQKAAAEAIGRSTAHVSKRVKLASLVPEVSILAASIPIEDAVELAGLPEKAQRSIARKLDREEAPSTSTIRGEIDYAKRKATRARQAEKAAAAYAKAHPKATVSAKATKGWRSLEGFGGLRIDQDAHEKTEACHRVVVGFPEFWDAEPRAVFYCAEPERHAPEGDSPLKIDTAEDKRQAKVDADRDKARAKQEADRKAWFAKASTAAADLDRNTALKVLSLYILTGATEDGDLAALIEAVGVPVPSVPDPALGYRHSSTEARAAWEEYDGAMADVLDGLTVAQTYRAAALFVLDNTALSNAQWQRQRPPAPMIAELIGVDPEPTEE